MQLNGVCLNGGNVNGGTVSGVSVNGYGDEHWLEEGWLGYRQASDEKGVSGFMGRKVRNAEEVVVC